MSTTELSTTVIPTAPVKVRVGDSYKFLRGQVITSCKIEKIYQDMAGETYLLITVEVPVQKWSDYGKVQTATIGLSEFKLRLVKGGIDEIEI